MPQSLRATLSEVHIVDAILAQFSIGDLVQVGAAGRELHDAIKDHFHRRVFAMLMKWVNSAVDFQDVMRKTGTILSGSSALQTMVPGNWYAPAGDLDVYVPNGHPRAVVIDHLVRKEGYTLCKVYSHRNWDASSPPDGCYYGTFMQLASVSKLTKLMPDGTFRFIDIVESPTSNAQQPVFSFAATFVMNWIKADGAVVAYPRLTLERTGFLIRPFSRREAKRQQKWAKKYEGRGFTSLVEGPGSEKAVEAVGAGRDRVVGDKDCLTLEFVNNVEADADQDSSVHWRLEVAKVEDVAEGVIEEVE